MTSKANVPTSEDSANDINLRGASFVVRARFFPIVLAVIATTAVTTALITRTTLFIINIIVLLNFRRRLLNFGLTTNFTLDQLTKHQREKI
jgi:hypothetical protein